MTKTQETLTPTVCNIYFSHSPTIYSKATVVVAAVDAGAGQVLPVSGQGE